MKFSESWLREFVDPGCTGEALSHLLTMAGLEVEEQETAAPPFNRVLVAAIVEVTRHPNADRLNVCCVDIGQGNIQQIVCGAPNAVPGIKVPCALPGAELPGDFKIKVAKVRGVESNGMLCSARELGIAEDASGLLVLPDDAPVGEDIRVYLNLDDTLRLLKLTPNRADCLSLQGIARETAALTGARLKLPEIHPVPDQITAKRNIHLDAPQACPRYCGRIIQNVNARAETPAWMKQRLERSGLRPISALVDITNYVMLELGQPLHAFDNDLLEGDIHARMATDGEKIRLLNEQTLELKNDVLVIADEKRPVAMAGIMGGEQTGITLDTRNLFLESAFFSPQAVAGRARRYGFVSDSSHRFERGVDFGRCREVIEHATRLVVDICGGQPGPVIEPLAPLPPRMPILMRTARVTKVLGIELNARQIVDILTRLHFDFKQEGDNFIITPPTYRFDLQIEADLIEEVARLYGYDNIPAPLPQARLGMLPLPEDERPLARIRQILTDRGFQEVINYAFIDQAWEDDFAANALPIRLANPIASNMSVMRSTLIGGLIANIATNLKRKQNRVCLFETGRCFLRNPDGKPVQGFDQPLKIAALIYGNALPENWSNADRQADFYDIKGEVEQLLAPHTARFEKAAHPALHPGRSAKVILDGKTIGFVGELHPRWQQKYDLPLAPVLFELDLATLIHAQYPRFTEVSQQPPVIRDLAILVDQTVQLQQILDSINEIRLPLVQAVRLFDVYTGKGVIFGKKSLAFRIVMQDTQRTLQDADVDAVMQQLIDKLRNNFDAQLRA